MRVRTKYVLVGSHLGKDKMAVIRNSFPGWKALHKTRKSAEKMAAKIKEKLGLAVCIGESHTLYY